MAGAHCRNCGAPVPPGDRFCGQCGLRYFPARDAAPLGPPYWGLRWQIDPLSPPPRRDVRYTLIVLGLALTIVGILFLAVSAIVSDALSATCSRGSCSGIDPGIWLLWIALPFLAVGVGIFALGLWWALRPGARAG